MNADEEYVRSAWEWCRVRFSEPHEGYAQGVYVAEVPMWKTSRKVESEGLSRFGRCRGRSCISITV